MGVKDCGIVLVDDHTLFRGGLKTLLNAIPGFKVVGEAANGVEFLTLTGTFLHVDVVLLDIDMPVMGGIEAAEKALKRNPEMKIITLSMYGEEDYYFKMVSLGVKGFLLKNSTIDQVRDAIITVVEGGSYFSQELLFTLVNNLKATTIADKQPVVNEEQRLSERELEIVLLICRGDSNSDIAEKLFISKRTVDTHRANILDKTGCKNTANLVVYAIKHNLVEI